MGGTIVTILLWLLSVSAIIVGIYRLCRCLLLVQEVSIASEEFQTKKLVEAFKTALKLHEKEKEEELSIEFRDTFPYTCSRNTELEINFLVWLKKGKIARQAEVWFYVPDGFGLISPSEEKSWRQNNNFIVPNIRTIKINLGNISTGPSTPGSLKIKSPNVAGKYFLMYLLLAEGYFSSRKQIEVIVE